MSAPLALAVHDFFIGQHRPQCGTPVDGHFGDIGQTTFVQLEKDPLSPAVVVRIAGRYLTVPVIREAKSLNLTPEGLNIALGGLSWMGSGFNSVLFGGQPERVPAHRMQDVKAAHPLVAGQNIGRRVALRMADMQP